MRRPGRAVYVLLAVGTIVAGLALHFLGDGLPRVVRDVTGDALWAAMVFWWVSAIAPATRLRSRFAIALLISAGVELAQLYHSPILNSMRATTIGHLVLGSDFDARDLAAYTVGVLTASLAEWFYVVRSQTT